MTRIESYLTFVIDFIERGSLVIKFHVMFCQAPLGAWFGIIFLYCGGTTCAMRQNHPEDSLVVVAVYNLRDLPST
jgi:hypothetical protein